MQLINIDIWQLLDIAEKKSYMFWRWKKTGEIY